MDALSRIDPVVASQLLAAVSQPQPLPLVPAALDASVSVSSNASDASDEAHPVEGSQGPRDSLSSLSSWGSLDLPGLTPTAADGRRAPFPDWSRLQQAARFQNLLQTDETRDGDAESLAGSVTSLQTEVLSGVPTPRSVIGDDAKSLPTTPLAATQPAVHVAHSDDAPAAQHGQPPALEQNAEASKPEDAEPAVTEATTPKAFDITPAATDA